MYNTGQSTITPTNKNSESLNVIAYENELEKIVDENLVLDHENLTPFAYETELEKTVNENSISAHETSTPFHENVESENFAYIINVEVEKANISENEQKVPEIQNSTAVTNFKDHLPGKNYQNEISEHFGISYPQTEANSNFSEANSLKRPILSF